MDMAERGSRPSDEVWRATSSSLRGSSHGAESPNQDAVGFTRVTDDGGGTVWVGAVSDGHGGRALRALRRWLAARGRRDRTTGGGRCVRR